MISIDEVVAGATLSNRGRTATIGKRIVEHADTADDQLPRFDVEYQEDSSAFVEDWELTPLQIVNLLNTGKFA